MIMESTVIISTWLKHPVHGASALAATVPRKKWDDAAATFAKPKAVTIYDDIQDESVAMKLDPDKSPALVVFGDSDVEIPMQWGVTARVQGQRITIAICYL